ncbi:hypothetical protein MMM2322_01670 [Microbacterium sp. MM2322]
MRVSLLSAELDNTRDAALERTRLLNTKASFVVVAAGVIGSASSVGVLQSDSSLIWLLPFGLTFLTVLASTITLWPRSLTVAGGREMVETWRVSELTGEELEDHLLEVKAREVESRDAQYKVGARWTRVAFVLLLASLISVVVVASVEAFPAADSSGDVAPTSIISPLPE